MKTWALIVIVIVSLGCAVNTFGVKVAIGGAEIRDGCDAQNVCEDVTSSEPIGTDLLNFVLRILDAIPGVELNSGSVNADRTADPAAPVEIHEHEHEHEQVADFSPYATAEYVNHIIPDITHAMDCAVHHCDRCPILAAGETRTADIKECDRCEMWLDGPGHDELAWVN